jgi:hypothetical protein
MCRQQVSQYESLVVPEYRLRRFTLLGGHALRFSIGADDRQVIQPPASPTVPCTGLSVYNLFKELGRFDRSMSLTIYFHLVH